MCNAFLGLIVCFVYVSWTSGGLKTPVKIWNVSLDVPDNRLNIAGIPFKCQRLKFKEDYANKVAQIPSTCCTFLCPVNEVSFGNLMTLFKYKRDKKLDYIR